MTSQALVESQSPVPSACDAPLNGARAVYRRQGAAVPWKRGALGALKALANSLIPLLIVGIVLRDWPRLVATFALLRARTTLRAARRGLLLGLLDEPSRRSPDASPFGPSVDDPSTLAPVVPAHVDGNAIYMGFSPVPRSFQGGISYVRAAYEARGQRVPWARGFGAVATLLARHALTLLTFCLLWRATPGLCWAAGAWTLCVSIFSTRRVLVLALLDDPVVFPDVPRAHEPYAG